MVVVVEVVEFDVEVGIGLIYCVEFGIVCCIEEEFVFVVVEGVCFFV